MTHTGRTQSGVSPNSAVTPSYPPTDLSIRDILERWVGTDETLRAALTAHSSFSHRRSEEERTRQEYYRLETRRVEYELLREALRGGIHPSQVPQIFSSHDARAGPQNLSPISPILRQDERPLYPTSSLPSYNRPDLPRIDTSGLPPPSQPRHLVPSQHHRDKYAGPISAPPASMATTSPPPSIFFRHWAPPQPRTAEDQIGLRNTREDMEMSQRYHHQRDQDHQIPSPSSTRKSPPVHSNGISPKRSSGSSGSHGRQRSDAVNKMHDARHHPYAVRPLHGKKHEEDTRSGLGSTLDRETVMRALREKVAPRKEEEPAASSQSSKETAKEEDKVKEVVDKKEVERRKVEQTRDVMALEQLVESNGQGKE